MDAPSFLTGLQSVLADDMVPDSFPPYGGGLPLEIERQLHALRVSTPAYGTRSSTILCLQPGRVDQYLYAERLDDGRFTTYVPMVGGESNVF